MADLRGEGVLTETLIRLEGVSCRYRLPGGAFRSALEDISLEVREGDSLVVLGAGGAGKTSLAAVMAGLVAPSTGSVVRGRVLLEKGRTLPVGLVTQNPEDTFTSPVVREEMAIVLENLDWDTGEIDRSVDEMLDLIGLADRGDSSPSALSGGQKQLLAAASILIASPRLLLLDEPLSLLDARSRGEVTGLIDARRDAGGGMACFTSEVNDLCLGSRAVVLKRGRVVWGGACRDFPLEEERLEAWGLAVPDLTRLAGMLLAGERAAKARLWSAAELADTLCR